VNLTTVTPKVTYGQTASVGFPALNAWQTNAEEVSQGIEDRFELIFNLLIGVGVLSGTYTPDLVTAGSGLSVNVAAFDALLGVPIRKTVSSIVGGLAASDDNYIYLMQDGSFESNTTGVSPGTTSNPALLLAVATTDGSSVTSVDETGRVEIAIHGKGERELLYGDGLAAPFDVSPYAVAWDSTDGHDGSVTTVTLPFLLASGAPLHVYNGRERYVKYSDFSLSDDGTNTTLTFEDGAIPVAGTIVTVIATPA
jgi:hypothetical protein